jgi:hypothetical protein
MIIYQKISNALIILLLDSPIDRINSGHGFLVTAIGLIAVFLGLLVLWGITSGLQFFIEKISRQSGLTNIQSRNFEESEVSEESIDKEIIAAITIALHYELDDAPSKLTLRHHEQDMSPWVVASRPTTMRR